MRRAVCAFLLAVMFPYAIRAQTSSIPPVPAPLQLDPPKLLPAGRDYPITEFEAVADGITLNTIPIQKAIDACSANGGGTVVVPKGTFLTGALFLKKGVHLRLDQDAILKGSTNRNDYPVIDSRFEGIERPVMAALLNAINVDGISLTGTGAIDGSGDQWLANAPRLGRGRGTNPATAIRGNAASRPVPQQTLFTGPRTVLTPTPDNPPANILPGATLMRPRLVCFTNCNNILIKDLSLRNQAIWCLHILYCSDVLIDHLDIKDPTRRVPSSDGIDIDSSRRIHVDHTTIDVNDDCISIKSGKDDDGRRVNRPSENILITNTHFAYGHGGAAMGSEVTGGIRNVEIRDCLADSDNWAPIRFKSQPTRGGTVENIVYRNFTLNNTRQAFEFNLEWNMRINTPGNPTPTTVKNIYLINITGTSRSAGAIHGLPSSPISNVLFQDCALTSQTGLRITNARDLDTTGLHLTVGNGPPLLYGPAAAASAPAE